MIVYKTVSKIYPGGIAVLKKIDLHIKQKEFVSVVGHSGAGKSTLLKLLYAEERPTSGQVFFGQENITKLKANNYLIIVATLAPFFKILNYFPRKLFLKMWPSRWK